ncbi:hypothetical protein [Sulfitobacter sp.]|uniref:hypothetical protein n=1 Tax=Sulfitobacter sp. TaxID=1903071 RepID=UPI0030024220
MMTFFSRTILNIAASIFIAGSASAQSESDFIAAFSGDWYVFDSSVRTGQDICGLNLSGKKAGENQLLTTKGCTAPLSEANQWAISEGRIIISKDATQMAVLGGSQFRVTGDMANSKKSIVIERAQGDGNSAKIAAALRKHTCYFLGFTQKCAVAEDLKVPETSGETKENEIEVLVTLIARAQPRRDASAVGNIAQGTTVKINQCLTASDGPWCSAVIGETIIWLGMTAVRLNEWPILTFRAL